MNKKDIELLAEAYDTPNGGMPTQFDDIKVRRFISYVKNQIENFDKVNEAITTLKVDGRYDIRIDELLEELSNELTRLGIYEDLKKGI